MFWFKSKAKKNREYTPIIKPVNDWELVAVCNDVFSTNFIGACHDGTDKRIKWKVRFYQCKNTGKRMTTDNRKSDAPYGYSTIHAELDSAIADWVDAALLPKQATSPSAGKLTVADLAAEKELSPILTYQKTLADIAQTLGVVINRNFDLEARYPELKEAADHYHTVLEHVKTMDALKYDPNKEDD